mmetsp:Transcript_15591/g.36927  ORF Transcript_15591/g.36927 Transcript_15591/m.36927 type:complete len:270 (+) Transcript_15591:921-1730(+)
MRGVAEEDSQVHMSIRSMEDVVFDHLPSPERATIQQVLPHVGRIDPGRPVEAEAHKLQLLRVEVRPRLHAEEGGTSAGHENQKTRSQQQKDQERRHYEGHRVAPIPALVDFRCVVPADEHGVDGQVDAIGLCCHVDCLLILRQFTLQNWAGISDDDAAPHASIHGIATVKSRPRAAAVFAHRPVAGARGNVTVHHRRCAPSAACHEAHGAGGIHVGARGELQVACIAHGPWLRVRVHVRVARASPIEVVGINILGLVVKPHAQAHHGHC